MGLPFAMQVQFLLGPPFLQATDLLVALPHLEKAAPSCATTLLFQAFFALTLAKY